MEPLQCLETNRASNWDQIFDIDLQNVIEHARILKQQIRHTTYYVTDFFSGCGGLSYGFHILGKHTGVFETAGALELDKHANLTYARNLGVIPFSTDLGKISVDELKKMIPSNRPLIVMGGPPCQGFSSHKKRFPGRDARNRLVEKFGAIAVGLGADIIIMENVPDLIAKRHWHHYEYFQSILEENGYKIAAGIVNAAEYGVPQERFRLIVIAARHFIPTLPKPILSRREFRTVRQAIFKLPALVAGGKSPIDQMHVTSRHRQETVQNISRIPKDGGSRPVGVGPACLDRVAGFYDVYGRLWWDRPAITITARCRTPSCGRYSHPEQNRGLSVREAALLQSFPPDYCFEGPFDDKFKQIGNAVPPLFSLRLAEHVLSMITGNDRGRQVTPISEPTFASFSIMIAHFKSGMNRSVERSRESQNG